MKLELDKGFKGFRWHFFVYLLRIPSALREIFRGAIYV